MINSWKQNMGALDRFLRISVGLALVTVGTFVVGGTLGIILMILSIVPFTFGVAGFCPLYVPFGISTKTAKSNAKFPLSEGEMHTKPEGKLS